MKILPENSPADMNVSVDADSINSDYQKEPSVEGGTNEFTASKFAKNRLNLRQPLENESGSNTIDEGSSEDGRKTANNKSVPYRKTPINSKI